MKTGKRVLSIFLVVLLLLTAAPLAGFVGVELAPKAEAYSVGDHIQFGTYPQTSVDETPELHAAANVATWKSYKYYSGTGFRDDGNMMPSDYMTFADFFSGGNKYRAVKLNRYRPEYTGYTFPDSFADQEVNGYSLNNIYYFKYEPLNWRVLDPSEGYIMCESIVDSQPYQNTIYMYSSSSTCYQAIDSSVYANDYAKSSIRDWLNYDFYETAFTAGQKAKIKTTALINNAYNTSHSQYNSATTNDKIYLLSYVDAYKTSYGFSSSASSDTARWAQGTDYARCQGLYVSTDSNYKGNSWWWLRSPGMNAYDACDVSSDGKLYVGNYVNCIDEGIRPACKLTNLTSDVSISESLFSEVDPLEGLDTDNDVNETVEFGSSKSVGVELDRNWFSQSISNKRYHHGLARFCAAFSMLGYSTNKKITSYLQQCGFNVLFRDMNTGRDEVNTFIAWKQITVDGAKKNLIFVGTIGSNDDQWYSDFDPYGRDRDESTPKTAFTDTHLGFADARDYAYEMLKNALKTNGLDQQADKNILLFTGHSRGAATANILAAKVIDEGIWANQNSIYAYTFATPNSVCDKTLGKMVDSAKYSSIFNIVNPEDFVTKVMLRNKWHYYRYGKTLVLPSRTNTVPEKYRNYLRKMQEIYKEFSDEGVYHPFSCGEVSTWSAISLMQNHVETVDDFYHKDFSYLNYLNWRSPYYFFRTSLLVCLAEKGLSKLPGIMNLLNTVKYNPTCFYTQLILYFSNLNIDYLLKLSLDFALKSEDEIVNDFQHLMNVSDFANAHAADTYCAYMYALSKKELTDPKKSYIGAVNCPVDVEIIDKETNEVVGRIVDNVVDEEIFAKENSVVMTVDGDKKSFWLPSDGDYEVKLSGNNVGTMDYTLAVIDSDAGELGRTNFFDVPLTDGLTYTSDVGSEDFSLPAYTLTREDGTVMQPDESFDAENATAYTVSVNADENGFAEGAGVYTSGDYATVYAFSNDGYEFDGWYKDETLVSSEATFRFRVDSDVTLTAKFKQHEHVYESAITTAPTCTANGETTYTCSCGDSYTELIPATGNHVDADNDGYCDTCEQQMTGGDHCKYCGKIHDGFFGWLVKFFHNIFAIFKR